MKKILILFILIGLPLLGLVSCLKKDVLTFGVDYNLITVGEIIEYKLDASDDATITSSNPDIVLVKDGVLEAKMPGTVTITASMKKLETSIEIEVIEGEITKADDQEMLLGDELVLSELFDTNFCFDFTYEIEDENVVRIEDNTLKAIGEGTTKLTARLSRNNINLEAFINISVTIPYEWPDEERELEAVYLGISNYGSVTSSQMNDFRYKFASGGTTSLYSISRTATCELQNLLEEGNIYRLKLDGIKITSLTKLDDPEPFNNDDEVFIREGVIEEITDKGIKINNTYYKLFQDSKAYKITKAVGGSSVSSVTAAVGDKVRISITALGNCQNIYVTTLSKDYTPPVVGTPGERTLTNFFKTALSAVGVALYIYGGTWNFQDDGSSNQARTIGVAQSWINFFYEQGTAFQYKNESNKAKSYYPHGSYNAYYYAGVDCSGFVGWVMYNVLNTVSGNPGYVMGSTKMAKYFAELGLGTYTRNYSEPTSANSDFKVGDIISTDGHVWICLGVCNDGSMVIIHSTPSDSKAGKAGGGAQLGAIGKSTSCEAYVLADEYNKQYYPDWSARYDTALRGYAAYTTQNKATSGKFSWTIGSAGLTDPDNLVNSLPDAILAKIFA